VNVFAEDTYTKVESIDGQDIRVKIMDTCDNVSFAKKNSQFLCVVTIILYSIFL